MYGLEEVAEAIRTYGEISASYALVREEINLSENVERCLIALSNYQRNTLRKIRQQLGINVKQIRADCERALIGLDCHF